MNISAQGTDVVQRKNQRLEAELLGREESGSSNRTFIFKYAEAGRGRTMILSVSRFLFVGGGTRRRARPIRRILI